MVKISTKKAGFTIVELLIAIVVIAILAALVYGSFSNSRAQARDAVRKQQLQALAEVFDRYYLANDTYVGDGSGCGLHGNGNGWLRADINNSNFNPKYQTSIADCLKPYGLDSKDVIDPSGCIDDQMPGCGYPNSYSYMKISCVMNGRLRLFLFAELETIPQSSTATDNTCPFATDFTSGSINWDSWEGMNYVLEVK